MSLPFGQRAEGGGRSVPPVVFALLVLALLGVVGWSAWSSFAGPPAGKLPPPPTENLNFIKQKAMECQGDFNKLNPEDQTKIQQITQGFGAATMASTYREATQPKK